MGGFVKNIFYDDNGNSIDIGIRDLLKKGIGTKVYNTSDNECLKIFTNSFDDLDMFKTLSELDVNNFYKITKLLFDKDKKFIAYTAKFYQKEDIDILTMPIDYTVENMKRLYIVSDMLSDNKIEIEDLHHENVILNSKDIIIIDADRYVSNVDKDCHEYNRRCINSLFTLLYMVAPSVNFLAGEQNSAYVNKNIRRIFFSENTPDVVYKKLSKYKRPIDYLRDK